MQIVDSVSGVFVASIKKLLVVVTSSEIILLGVSFLGDELQLHRTGLHYSTDDITMLTVVGSAEGRIFAGGKDGHIYEFIYQAEEGWFTRKCRKINRTASFITSLFAPNLRRVLRVSGSNAIIQARCDATRGLLYTLSQDSSIRLYEIGGKDFDLVASIDDISHNARRLCPTLGDRNLKIVSLSVIEASESTFVHLVAFTSGGIRLYFTALPRDERAFARSQLLTSNENNLSKAAKRPLAFEMVHVRLPPPDDLKSTSLGARRRDVRQMIRTWSPNVHTAFSSAGVTILVHSVAEDPTSDKPVDDYVSALLQNQALAFAPRPNTTPLEVSIDSFGEISIEGRVWDISECPPEFQTGSFYSDTEVNKNISSSFLHTISPLPRAPRTFLILTSSAIYILEQGTVIDELKRRLTVANGHIEDSSVTRFFSDHAPEQACFMAALLAVRALLNNQNELFGWCNAALIHYGRLQFGQNPTNSYLPFLENTYKNTGIHGQNINIIQPMGNDMIQKSFEFSPLHRSLYILFARLIAPIWHCSICQFTSLSTEAALLIHSLINLISTTPSVTTFRVPNAYSNEIEKSGFNHLQESLSISQVQHQQALQSQLLNIQQNTITQQKTEAESIKSLQGLAVRALELAAFFSICADYKVMQMAPAIDFQEALTTGKGAEVVSELGARLVQRQLSLRAPIESLCQVLLARCPSFFSDSDALLFHGAECVEHALKSLPDAAFCEQRNRLISESVQYTLRGIEAIKAISRISLPSITVLCDAFDRLGAYRAIIDVCLAILSKAKHLVPEKTVPVDGSSIETYHPELIENVSKIVLESLKGLFTNSLLDATSVVDTVQYALRQSEDYTFHSTFYSWLISESYTSVLLELRSEYLEHYLQNLSVNSEDDTFDNGNRSVEIIDLYWRFLARSGRSLDAAAALEALVLSDSNSRIINLQQRIERLSLALTHARAASSGSHDTCTPKSMKNVGELVTDLEERLEVARLQAELLSQVRSQYGEVIEASELEQRLFDVSALFNKYARPMRLDDACLRIMHCSSHRDAILLHQLWTSLLEKALQKSQKKKEIISGTVSPPEDLDFCNVGLRLSELAAVLYPSQYAFPLNFVLDYLLQAAIRDDPTSACDRVVTQALLPTVTSHIPIGDWLEEAVNFWHSQASFWRRSPENRRVLAEVITTLMNSALDSTPNDNGMNQHLIDVLSRVQEIESPSMDAIKRRLVN